MKTKTDLENMTTLQLRTVAKELSVTNYGRMSKEQMIAAILEKQSTPAVPTDETEAPVYTDRHEKPITEGQQVNCRIGGSWFPGQIAKFKEVEGELYVHVLLEGRDTTKMFHSTDVDSDGFTSAAVTASKREKLDALLKKTATPAVPAKPAKPVKPAPEVKPEVAPEVPTVENPMPEMSDLESNKAFDLAKNKLEIKSEDKAERDAAYKASQKKKQTGVPMPGSKTAKMVELLKAGKSKTEVAKLTNSVYQFVHSTEKRYLKNK